MPILKGVRVPTAEQRRELAEFVRGRRERRTPAEVGLPLVGRRRTPGLRREEVATLAGVSVTWYTWLEQARDIRVSRQVLGSLSRALGLDPVERAHLYRLSGELPPPDAAPGLSRAEAQFQMLLDHLDPSPAFIANARFDILAWNRGAALFYGDLGRFPTADRNVLWLMFTSSDIRALSEDWEQEAAYTVALFRAGTGEHVLDPSVSSLIARVSAASDDFRRLWARQDLAPFVPESRILLHPALGRVELEYLKLRAVNDDRTLVAYLAPPGSSLEAELAKLVADQPA